MTTKKKKENQSNNDSVFGRLRHCFGEYRIESERYTDRKKIILINGVVCILSYTPETVLLDMGGETLEIRGKCLLCRTYVSGTVEVIGEIDGMGFCFSTCRTTAKET